MFVFSIHWIWPRSRDPTPPSGHSKARTPCWRWGAAASEYRCVPHLWTDYLGRSSSLEPILVGLLTTCSQGQVTVGRGGDQDGAAEHRPRSCPVWEQSS